MMDNFIQMAKNGQSSKEKMDKEFETFSTYLMVEYEKNLLRDLAGPDYKPFSDQKEHL